MTTSVSLFIPDYSHEERVKNRKKRIKKPKNQKKYKKEIFCCHKKQN